MRKVVDSKLRIDEKGSVALIMTLVLSIAVVTTFVVMQSYLNFRIKTYERLKDAYQLANILEEASKLAKSNYDTVMAQAVAASLPFNPALVTFTPDPTCSGTCAALTGLPPQMCFQNINNPSLPYCFYGGGVTAQNQIDFKLPVNSPGLQPLSRVEKAFVYMEHFFNNTLAPMREGPGKQMYVRGSILDLFQPEVARATSSTARQDTVTWTSFTCTPGVVNGAHPECMTCGNATGRPCVNIFACPASFESCQAYTGNTAGALFSQTFYLVPPNINE